MASETDVLRCHFTTRRALLKPPALPLIRLLRWRLTPLRCDEAALETALHEAIANAAIHGNLGIPATTLPGQTGLIDRADRIATQLRQAALASRLIHIRATRGQNTITICVQDQGAGFAVEAVQAPNPALSHGRGLFLMRSLAQSVSFADGGRAISLTFGLSAPVGGHGGQP